MNAKGFFDLCVPEKHFRPDNCFFTLQALRESEIYLLVSITRIVNFVIFQGIIEQLQLITKSKRMPKQKLKIRRKKRKVGRGNTQK